MFSKLAIVATTAFAVLAIASPTPGGGDNNQCQTGPQQCCDSVQDSKTNLVQGLLGSLGIQLGAGIPVGVTCSPITAVGIAGNSCSQQPVCCNNNNFNGLIAIGCTPININL